MYELKSVSYEQCRREFLEREMQKAQNRIDFWKRKLEKAKAGTAQLECHKNAGDAGWECNYYKDALEALENQPKWISVEERLPEYDAKVLVVIPRYYGCDIRTAKLYKSGAWLIGDMSAVGSTPTHWMPLPEPPKEVK